MKTLLTLLLLAASAFAQTATISDTIRTPFGGTFSGTVTVSLNSPALAQPLYSGNVTLSGWTQSVTVTAGVFTLTLYTNDLITPGGTSYTATYAPTSGSGWKETWIVPTGATTIREIRSTTVPSPSVRFTPSQITQAGATLGQGLKWDGSKWAPADVVANPMTTNGDLITRLGGVPVRVGIGSTNQVLTVSGGMPVWASGITGNASTASALAANPADCSAGQFATTIAANGDLTCAAVALADVSGAVGGASTLTTPGSVPFVTAAGVLGQSANLFWDNANARLGVGTATPSVLAQFNGIVGVTAGSFSQPSGVGGLYFNFSSNVGSITAVTSGISGRELRIFGHPLTFGSSQTAGEQARFAPTSGNLLLGTTTDDGSNRLQVAGGIVGTGRIRTTGGNLEVFTGFGIQNVNANGMSISFPSSLITMSSSAGQLLMSLSDAGALELRNATPTTGSTSLVVRAGAGQGSNNLTTWQNSGGTQIAAINSAGIAFTEGLQIGGGGTGSWQSTAIRLRSDSIVAFASGTNATGTLDLSLSRASAGRLQVGDGGANANGQLLAQRMFLTSNTTNPHLRMTTTGFGFWEVYTDFNNTDSDLWFRPNGTATGSAFTNVNNLGNWTFGGQGSAAFKIDVASSGSSGGLRVWDQTPTVGSTSLVVRAGAGQTGNLFSVRNASNVEQFWVNAFGPEANNFIAVTRFRTNSNEVGIEATSGLDLASNRLIRYSSTTDYSGTKDLSLSRASANTLQVGDGSANSNGTILARIHTWANGTEGTCDATLRGQVVMVQGGAGVADTFRVCRKDAANVYAWTALY